MYPEEIRRKLSNIIYDLLDAQGHMPTQEMNEELREVRCNVIDLQNKLIEYILDNKNKLI